MVASKISKIDEIKNPALFAHFQKHQFVQRNMELDSRSYVFKRTQVVLEQPQPSMLLDSIDE